MWTWGGCHNIVKKKGQRSHILTPSLLKQAYWWKLVSFPKPQLTHQQNPYSEGGFEGLKKRRQNAGHSVWHTRGHQCLWAPEQQCGGFSLTVISTSPGILVGKPSAGHVRPTSLQSWAPHYSTLLHIVKISIKNDPQSVCFALMLKNPPVALVNREELKKNMIQQAVGICPWHQAHRAASPHSAKWWRGQAATGEGH